MFAWDKGADKTAADAIAEVLKMNDNLTDEVVELAARISALSVGYSNTAVLFAAINVLAQQVAAIAGTESELVQFSDTRNGDSSLLEAEASGQLIMPAPDSRAGDSFDGSC